MTTLQEPSAWAAFEALSMTERNAFLAFFAGARSRGKSLVMSGAVPEGQTPKLACSTCGKKLSRKTARIINGKLICSGCLFPKLKRGIKV